MIITCATIEATAQVLAVLLDARLMPGRDFHITPQDGGVPITVTILADLPAGVLRQLRALPDTTIT
jgi:hypothetical protein